MKSRFSTADIIVIIQELKKFLDMRVINVYDIDNKTYLIRVGKPDEKTVILLESGIRLHSTDFDWPKNPAPSGFSMKLRKHLKGRRLESVTQLGIDRIVDLQFGSGEAAYHVILELYDRGNMVLTDYEYTILTLLRPRTDAAQDVKFAVREKYPVECSKTHQPPTRERILEVMKSSKDGDVLKKLLIPNLDYGPAIIDHVLLGAGFPENVRFGKGFSLDTDFDRLMDAIQEAEDLLKRFMTEPCKGYITKKKDKKPNPQQGEEEDILLYEEFHPYLYRQFSKMTFSEFDRFDQAIDEFFSKIESQRLDMKIIQQEKTVLKKLEHVKKDNEKRIEGLQKEQESDILRGQLIEMNLALVDQAILIVNSAVANQIDWTEIWTLVKEAQLNGDQVASAIKSLKLDSNQITLLLHDPFATREGGHDDGTVPLKPMRVDIDLGLSAYSNSKKYFDKKRQAAKKEQKTLEASKKALKSAERKTKQTLKEVATAASINKTRKTYWFEKFLWFISSENYLVIGGRDQQQNELIVKRYMRPGDLYVHADLHGASSCVIKNPGGNPVPPKTLNEAGTMAICNSAAWDSKVVTSAWWVYHDQVSKTAPSGEYLTTGSFMIRGKKNFLPPSYLIYGFGFMFKLEDGSIERHKGERRVKVIDDDALSVTDSAALSVPESDDVDIDISDDGTSEDESDADNKSAQSSIKATARSSDNPSLNTEDDNVNSEETIHLNEESDKSHSSETNNSGDTLSASEKKPDLKVSRADVERELSSKGVDLGFEFPDTSINLLHVKGDKYELHREFSTSSTSSVKSDTFFLGDGVPVTLGEKISSKSGKLSAKQRRDIKKQKKGQPGDRNNSDDEDAVSMLDSGKSAPNDGSESDTSKDKAKSGDSGPGVSAAPAKRGQRAKLKKIKDKYADQDDEERRLKMEILASAGPQKEDKKAKNKKGKDHHLPKQQRPPQGQKFPPGKGQKLVKFEGNIKPPESDMADEIDQLKLDGEPGEDTASAAFQKQEIDSDGEKDEETNVGNDEAILNSLTGIPLSEDELLYAIPVCAPYGALLNYKYKVKLMPGSGKKGKAVKTALNMFIHEKTATSREKDLLEIQKDVDLARNVPGKVKVAAPNIQKHKK